MKIKTNYHSHNTFCDGKSTMEDMVLSAIDRHFTHFGISSHAPYPLDNDFALKEEDFFAYITEFERLKDKYKDKIRLFSGLEMDFVPYLVENIRQNAEEKYNLDYFIGSVHQVVNTLTEINSPMSNADTWFIDGSKQEKYDIGLETLFGGDIRKGVTCFYTQQIQMIEKNSPDVLGHADKIVMHNKDRYFKEDEQWYKDEVVRLWDTVIKYGTIVEVNTRGIYRKRHSDFYPSSSWLKYLTEKHIPLTIATDCHKAEETDSCYKEALEYLKYIGCKELYYFDGSWKAEKIENFIA